MSLSMATGKSQSLAMPIVMASFLSSAVVVLFDDDRAAVDDALHEHLHLGQDGHAGHALGMQDLHSKVIGGIRWSSFSWPCFNMKVESSRVACEESMEACSLQLELLFINLLMFLGSSSRRALAIEPWLLILHMSPH